MRKSYIYNVETVCNTKNELADAMDNKEALIAYTCKDNMELKKAMSDKLSRRSENALKNVSGAVSGICAAGALVSGGSLLIPMVGGVLVGAGVKKFVGYLIGDQMDNYSAIMVPSGDNNEEIHLVFIRNSLIYNFRYDYITYGQNKFIVLDNRKCPYCHKKLSKDVWYGTFDCTEGDYAIKLSDKALKQLLSDFDQK